MSLVTQGIQVEWAVDGEGGIVVGVGGCDGAGRGRRGAVVRGQASSTARRASWVEMHVHAGEQASRGWRRYGRAAAAERAERADRGVRVRRDS